VTDSWCLITASYVTPINAVSDVSFMNHVIEIQLLQTMLCFYQMLLVMDIYALKVKWNVLLRIHREFLPNYNSITVNYTSVKK